MRGGCALTALVWVIAYASPCLAEPEEWLVKKGRTRATAAVQFQAGLARAQRALELLTTSDDIEALKAAEDAVGDAYVYLRSAHATVSMVYEGRRTPDPILGDFRDRLERLRMKYIFPCAQNRQRLSQRDQPLIQRCVEELDEGIRQLEVLFITMP
jgi:hypothetical protein